MEHLKNMVDMALDQTDKNQLGMTATPTPDYPKYPYGLCIRLTHNELEKLGVDHNDWSIGDMFHLFAMAKVTSISSHESEGGDNCCVEMQITHLAGESESEENEDMEEQEETPEEEAKEQESAPEKKRRPNYYF